MPGMRGEANSPNSGDINQPEYPTGRKLSLDHEVDINWYKETKAGSATAINDSLRQFATLSAVIFGLVAGFFDKASLPPWSRNIGCGILLFTLGAALYGALPLKLSFGPMIEAIREERDRLYAFKRRWYRVAAISLFVGLAVFLAGIVVSAVKPSTPTTTPTHVIIEQILDPASVK